MCVCVYCYANVSIHHLGSAAKAADGYYWLYMITPMASWNTEVYVRTEQQDSPAAVDQLVPVSLSFTTGILQESVLVIDPFSLEWNHHFKRNN